ncbi:hypothetical protein CP985_10080 [Malaciobacter mytili LMG 24559]|uniref:DUF1574 domain-containing protein n=1 Tax=Malaciobacter mytili LMG 24559 TaxID=1032238 RepID=A0AAX2AI77_9BACT|nr:hypothetical protein [Malaciobacter mytili]AXH14158.1 DUF1574 domain-containing protein [Malaciobacter mytili LMG 24559]RXK15151.1 hypothetical protein CP985_10080 [Malaciobacter mytili LMG 24559]
MYKRFISILIITMFFCFCIFTYVTYKEKKFFLSKDYPMRVFVMNTVLNKQNIKYSTIVLGDSRVQSGFIPKAYQNPLNAINLSMSGSTPIEGYFILKKYLLNNIKPDNIILSYAPFHLTKQDSYWKYTVKHQLFTNEEYEEVENNANLLKDDITLGTKRTFKDYRNLFLYSENFIKGILSLRFLYYTKIIDEMNYNLGHHYHGKNNGNSGLNEEIENTDFKYSPLIDMYMRKLISLAKENNIKIFYYTMPFNESSYKKVTKDYKRNYSFYVESLNINVCNKIFYMNDSMFGDPSHLYKGSIESTMLINKCILNSK